MHCLTAAIGQLLQQLNAEFPASAGIRLLSVSVPASQVQQQLAWLAAQPFWPQFYWQQRDGHESLAALGSVIGFNSLAQGQAYICNPEVRELALTVCGLNAFEVADSALFIPRLLWHANGSDATLALVIASEHSLADDACVARAFLSALAAPVTPVLEPQPLLRQQHFPEAAEWQQLLGQALNAIDNQIFDKVVLARASDLYFPHPVSASGFLAASQRVNARCFHFYMGFNPQQAFIGSSPERLWRRRGQALRTEALAGTAANHPDDDKAQVLSQWLIHDDKNQRENMLVVEDIRQRLTRAVSTLDILPPQVVRLRKVQHLRRCIWGALYHDDDAQCLQLLQPTAAVAGLPRQAALDFIRHNEPFERHWYAGSAGYLTPESSEFCVALRCGEINGERVRLYAGAGIVNGSDPRLEWQEIENKAAGLRTLLCSE